MKEDQLLGASDDFAPPRYEKQRLIAPLPGNANRQQTGSELAKREQTKEVKKHNAVWRPSRSNRPENDGRDDIL